MNQPIQIHEHNPYLCDVTLAGIRYVQGIWFTVEVQVRAQLYGPSELSLTCRYPSLSGEGIDPLLVRFDTQLPYDLVPNVLFSARILTAVQGLPNREHPYDALYNVLMTNLIARLGRLTFGFHALTREVTATLVVPGLLTSRAILLSADAERFFVLPQELPQSLSVR